MDRAFLTNTATAAELILVRHGQQDYPKDLPRATTADWVDPPLSAIGNRQAVAVGESMADEVITAVYSSNLERAHETGRQIARHHGLEVTVLEALREIELFRDLPEGKTLLDAVDPILLRGARERWVQDRRWDVYPFSETGDEFRHRILMAVEGILATHPGERIVVACHGGVINAVTGAILGLARGHVLPTGPRLGAPRRRPRRASRDLEPQRDPPPQRRRPRAGHLVGRWGSFTPATGRLA